MANKTGNSAAAASAGGYSRWSKIAGAIGAAGVAAAGGAVAYRNRESLTTGMSWMQEHLQFVGILVRGQELSTRVKRASTIPGVGFEVFYTQLELENKDWKALGGQRTFCILPDGSELREHYHVQKNRLAKDEVDAHVHMFQPDYNSGFYQMMDKVMFLFTKSLILLNME